LTVDEKITEQIGVVGEKLDLSSYATITADKVVAYNHPGNQLATLSCFEQQYGSCRRCR
jgi:elongation factor Ts